MMNQLFQLIVHDHPLVVHSLRCSGTLLHSLSMVLRSVESSVYLYSYVLNKTKLCLIQPLRRVAPNLTIIAVVCRTPPNSLGWVRWLRCTRPRQHEAISTETQILAGLSFADRILNHLPGLISHRRDSCSRRITLHESEHCNL
jgi:hypothetical protein